MVKKIIYSIIIMISIYMGMNLYSYKSYGATVPGEEAPKDQTTKTQGSGIPGEEAPKDKTTQTQSGLVPGEEAPTKETPSTVDSVIEGAQSFLDTGTKGTVKEAKLKSTSNFIYNILLGIAMVVAVIIGMIIGIQFMVVSVEEKAKIKEALVPYVVGCIVVFGAFGIWKLAMNILSKW